TFSHMIASTRPTDVSKGSGRLPTISDADRIRSVFAHGEGHPNSAHRFLRGGDPHIGITLDKRAIDPLHAVRLSEDACESCAVVAEPDAGRCLTLDDRCPERAF